MKITITEEDIKKGKHRSCSSCPTALALQRTLGHKRVSVLCTKVRVNTDWYPLPNEVQDFIIRFEKELPVEPFSFELKL